MYLKYIGSNPNFKHQDFDFSDGPVEVPDALAKVWLRDHPMAFAKTTKPEKLELIDDTPEEGSKDVDPTTEENKEQDPAPAAPAPPKPAPAPTKPAGAPKK